MDQGLLMQVVILMLAKDMEDIESPIQEWKASRLTKN